MSEFEVEEIMAEPNETGWMSSVVDGGFEISHAWFIVVVAGIAYYLWNNKVSPRYYQWKNERILRKSLATTKKDIDEKCHIEEARMSAVNRLQEEYNKLALKAQAVKKEKEDKKKQETISKLSNFQGGRKLNDNYYPLSGQGSRSYLVSPKRTGCKGGC